MFLKNPPFMQTIEQRAIDLLQDNNSSKSFYSHSNFDANLRFMINQSCSHIQDKISQAQLVHPPEILDQVVLNNLNRDGFTDVFKVDCILVLSSIIPPWCI